MTILRNPNAGPVPFHKYSTLLQCCRWLLSTRMVISCKLGQPKSPPTIYTEPGSFPRALGFQYHLRRRTYIGGYLPVLELGFSVFLSSLNQVRGPCWRDEKCQDWPLVVHSQNLLCKKGLFYCTMFNEFTLQHSNLTIGLLMVYLYPSSVHDEDDSPIWNSNWVFFVPLLCLIVRGQNAQIPGSDSRLRLSTGFLLKGQHWRFRLTVGTSLEWRTHDVYVATRLLWNYMILVQFLGKNMKSHPKIRCIQVVLGLVPCCRF